MVPFVFGVVAALVGLFLYNAIRPPAQPLTVKQVSTVVAQAMASATPPPAYSAQVFGVIQPSLVLIETTGVRNRGFGEDITGAADGDGIGLGSGVLISDQGEILTAPHVVAGASNINVTFADGTEAKAKIAGGQPENDIAVLQPDKLPEVLVPAVMGNPNAVRVGDEAFAFGNPFGLYGSLSTGVISGLHRSFHPSGSGQAIDDLIQIDSAVNPGNSGGPLLNRYGQVIGIVVALLNPTDQEFFVGIGFAVPITTAAGAAGAPQY
jgi:S1-C subfamily serine protease